MKAAFFNPYWDTLGGGERYTLSFAKVLEDLGYENDIQWRNKKILKLAEKRFGIKFENTKVVKDVKKGDGYDLCFWISDGSIPLLRSRKNILHFQVPFKDVNGKSLMNKMKLFRIKKVICNSQFTKNVIDEEYGINSEVVYPPCDVNTIKSKRKENIILNVGRFSQLLQSKHQDVLIAAFKRLVKWGLNDWKLVLAGGSDIGAIKYVEDLKKKAQGLTVEFLESADYKKIVNLLGVSKIFWSASGYNESEVKNPEKVEHFGISVVEAMAGGCVPVVFNAGGHKEIINESTGFLWKDVNGLVRITRKLVTDNRFLRSFAKESVLRSKYFSYENFEEKVKQILHQ